VLGVAPEGQLEVHPRPLHQLLPLLLHPLSWLLAHQQLVRLVARHLSTLVTAHAHTTAHASRTSTHTYHFEGHAGVVVAGGGERVEGLDGGEVEVVGVDVGVQVREQEIRVCTQYPGLRIPVLRQRLDFAIIWVS
jgi:hypothetical protein